MNLHMFLLDYVQLQQVRNLSREGTKSLRKFAEIRVTINEKNGPYLQDFSVYHFCLVFF